MEDDMSANMYKLVSLDWISEERHKYIWEDFYSRSWDEVIGRIYILKAHCAVGDDDYRQALEAFKQALKLLARPAVTRDYYYRALADTAIVHCYLDQASVALPMMDEALANIGKLYGGSLEANRAAILILTGAFSEALALLEQQLEENSDLDDYADLYLMKATCLLHMERYDEACIEYERIATTSYSSSEGLEAARQRRQPDWDCL
jgi:tetratricopeptide (TPR) repeat protein